MMMWARQLCVCVWVGVWWGLWPSCPVKLALVEGLASDQEVGREAAVAVASVKVLCSARERQAVYLSWMG